MTPGWLKRLFTFSAVEADHERPPPGGHWFYWMGYHPPLIPGGQKVEIWRHGWAKPQTIGAEDLHPAFNVAGLYWRWPVLTDDLLEPPA